MTIILKNKIFLGGRQMFKMQRGRDFILGMILTLLLVGTVEVWATGQVGKNIEVFYNNIKLVVDGKPASFGNDSNGNKIEPFIYNGTTYLPVRAVGDAMGKAVEWDGKTQTVFIGKRNDVSNYFLNHFQAYDYGSFYWTFGDTSKEKLGGSNSMQMGGERYYNGFKFGDPAYAIFNLNGKVNSISGIIGLDDFENKADTSINFIGDGKLLKTINLKAQTLPEDFSVDVSNVLQLKIEKGEGYSEVDFGEVIFK